MKSIGAVILVLMVLAGCRAGTIAAVGTSEALRPGSTTPLLYGPSLYGLQPSCHAYPDYVGGYYIRCY